MISMDYYASVSGLRKYNDGLKFLISMTSLLFCIGADSILFSVFIFILNTSIIIFIGKIPYKVYFKALKIPFLFLILSSVAILINIGYAYSGSALLKLNLFSYSFYITNQSLIKSITLFFRAMGAICCLYLLTFSTPSYEVIHILSIFRVPKLFTELMILIYRFIFVLTDTKNNMMLSSKVRLGNNGYKASWHTIGWIATNLLAISLRKSNLIYDAMESRCYTGSIYFYQENTKASALHTALGFFYVLLLIALFLIIKIQGWW